MKQNTAIEPATQDKLTKANLPKISYKKALELYFLAKQGGITTIKNASVGDMAHLVEQALKTLTDEPLRCCKRDLAGLDYTQLLDRWFALTTLFEAGAWIPFVQQSNG